jgi:hypothetical protein
MHAGMIFRQWLNQMLFVTKPWQRAAIAVVAAVGALAMIPTGIMLGHYEMSLGGALIFALVVRISLVALRAQRAGKAASR